MAPVCLLNNMHLGRLVSLFLPVHSKLESSLLGSLFVFCVKSFNFFSLAGHGELLMVQPCLTVRHEK